MMRGLFAPAKPFDGSTHKSSRGADLTDLVPWMQGSDKSYHKLRTRVEKDDDVIHADQLQRLSKLGEGGFGIVYKCVLDPRGRRVEDYVVSNSNMVAVKQLKSRQSILDEQIAAGLDPKCSELQANVSAQHKDAMHEFAHEVLMLKRLKHPNVIGYIGCAVFTVNGVEELALVLEYSEHGSLRDMIASKSKMAKSFTISEGLRWACDVASGMAFLHKAVPTIIHRDLKPANIMLCGPSRIAKVADFGLASLELERLKTEARRLNIAASRGVGKMMTGGVGSLRYMAPENYRGEAYTHTVDQYSFAVILYELLMRERAFEGMFLTPEMIADGASGAKKLRPPVPAVWPDEIKSLLERCWHTQADKRPPFKQVAQEISTLFLNGSPETNKLLKRIASGSKRGLLETMGIKRSV